MMTLEQLQPGNRYRVDEVDAADPVVQRLMVLGLVEGAEIELASSAIGGDPIESDTSDAAARETESQLAHVLVEHREQPGQGGRAVGDLRAAGGRGQIGEGEAGVPGAGAAEGVGL